MCFAPEVSAATAIFELTAAAYIFKKTKDKKLYPITIFVFLLGLYQASEFMLCQSNNPEFWATFGFACYTFIPIVLYHIFINLSAKKFFFCLYLLPLIFTFFAFLNPHFTISTSCQLLHVKVENQLYQKISPLTVFYTIFYFPYPTLGLFQFLKKIKTAKNRLGIKLTVIAGPVSILFASFYYLISTFLNQNATFTWLKTSFLLIVSLLIVLLIFTLKKHKKIDFFYKTNALILSTTIITTLILLFLVPNIRSSYGSIFCQFAIFYAIAAIFLINSIKGKIPRY